MDTGSSVTLTGPRPFHHTERSLTTDKNVPTPEEVDVVTATAALH